MADPYHVQLTPDNGNQPDPDSEPDTINEWFTAGGFLFNDFIQDDAVFEDPDQDGVNNPDDDVNRQNRIPVFCQFGFAEDGDTPTAGPCDDLCTTDTSPLFGTIEAGDIHYLQVTDFAWNMGGFVAEANSGVAIRAGNRINLNPCFHAEQNSYFSASIGSCDTPGGVGE